MRAERGIPQVSRRELFGLAKAGTIIAADVAFEADKWESFLAQTPFEKPIQKLYDPFSPGWIESHTRKPLMQKDTGHYGWFQDIIFNNPQLFEQSQNFFHFMQNYYEQEKAMPLGEGLQFAVQSVRDIAGKSLTKKSKALDEVESVHMGLLALTASFSPWMTERELKKLGMPIKEGQTTGEYFWNTKKGFGTVTYPKFYGIQSLAFLDKTETDLEPQWGGQDRAVHIVNHAMIAFEYRYAKLFGLDEVNMMPRVARLMVNAARLMKGTDRAEAEMFSFISGLGYEYKTTKIDLANTPPFIKKIPRDGLLDPMVVADLRGNKEGAIIGNELFDRALAGRSLMPIINHLNNPLNESFSTPIFTPTQEKRFRQFFSLAA